MKPARFQRQKPHSQRDEIRATIEELILILILLSSLGRPLLVGRLANRNLLVANRARSPIRLVFFLSLLRIISCHQQTQQVKIIVYHTHIHTHKPSISFFLSFFHFSLANIVRVNCVVRPLCSSFHCLDWLLRTGNGQR